MQSSGLKLEADKKMNNEFLTIQEFIQKYEVPDVRIRRRIRKYRLVDPQKLEGVLSERYDRGVGKVILLKEDFWVEELGAVVKDINYIEPSKEDAPPLKNFQESEPVNLSNDDSVVSPQPTGQSDQPQKQSEEMGTNRLSDTAYASDYITIEREFLEILKEDRAEKKDWIKKYEALLVDYKAKDNELVEREKFLQGLIEKIITDAKNTKHLLVAQINHLQKQLHAPKKEEGVEFENGSFTESKEDQTVDT